MKKFNVSDFGVKMENLNATEKAFVENILGCVCEVVNKSLDGAIGQEDLEEKLKGLTEQISSKGAKFEETAKELAEVTEQVKSLGETFEKLKSKGIGMEIVNKFDEKLNEMLDSEKFKDFADGKGRSSGTFGGFDLKAMSLENNYSGDYLLTRQSNVLVNPYPAKQSHMRDYMTTLEGDAEHTELAFTRVASMDRNARFVSENGKLPESMVSFEEVRTGVKRVGSYITISKRMLKSRAYVRSFILNFLPEAVLNTEDWQLLFGDGSGENLSGIIKESNVKPIETLIATAVTTIEATGVKSVSGYNSNADCVVEFAAPHPEIKDGMKITFEHAAVITGLNAAHEVIKMTDTQVLIKGVAYTGTETAVASMTATVNMAGFQSVEAPNGLDVINSIYAVLTFAQYTPTAILLNPIDIFAMETEKDTTGRTLNYVQTVNGQKVIGGRVVIPSTNIPVGHYLAGDFVNGAALIDYTALELEWADDVDSKLKNQVNLIAQEEIIFALYNPFSFAYGSLSALKSAITAPEPEDKLTLTVVSNDEDMGTVSGGGEYASGATASLVATAKSGYEFVQWNDGDTNATRSVTVSADAVYVATFAADSVGS